MLKSIIKIGKTLSKPEQKLINGGFDPNTVPHIEILPDKPKDWGIDDGPEDCNYPFVLNMHGRCVHCTVVGQCND